MDETLNDLQAAATRLAELRNVLRTPEQQLKITVAQRSLAEVTAMINKVGTSPAAVTAPVEFTPENLNFDQQQQVALVTMLELIKLATKDVLPAALPTLMPSVQLGMINRYRMQVNAACVASAFNSLLAGGNIEPRLDEDETPIGYVIKKRSLV
jgi:hypothetical protein